jgi:LmbE family N-acetylglucosaminyl deacetylase
VLARGSASEPELLARRQHRRRSLTPARDRGGDSAGETANHRSAARRDRHPDHEAASRLLTRASFLSGLARYTAEGQRWRADWLLSYFINDSTRPSFVVDVSAHYPAKRAALACHRSQFAPPETGAAATRLNTPRFQQLIESRDAQFGALIGVEFAEGVVVRELMIREHLLK